MSADPYFDGLDWQLILKAVEREKERRKLDALATGTPTNILRHEDACKLFARLCGIHSPVNITEAN